MTNNIDKLAEEIFEANDDLPQSVNSNTTIWIGVVEVDVVWSVMNDGEEVSDFGHFDGLERSGREVRPQRFRFVFQWFHNEKRGTSTDASPPWLVIGVCV